MGLGATCEGGISNGLRCVLRRSALQLVQTRKTVIECDTGGRADGDATSYLILVFMEGNNLRCGGET